MVVEDEVELSQGNVIQYVRFDGVIDAVCIVCFKDSKLLLQKEYSYPPNRWLYQFPGGSMRKGELPEVAARRELLEEASLIADELYPLGTFYTDNRRSNARMHVFLCEDPVRGKGVLDVEEIIETEWLAVSDFEARIKAGLINNQTTLAAWSLFKASRID